MKLGKVLNNLRFVFTHNFFISKEDKFIKDKIERNLPGFADGNEYPILLVPLIQDWKVMNIVHTILKKILADKKYSVKYFFVHTAVDREIKGSPYSVVQRIKEFVFYNTFFLKRICSIYRIPRKNLIASNYLPLNKIKSTATPGLKSEIIGLTHGDIVLGDLIYDHYLRFRNVPTVNLSDSNLEYMISYGILLTEYWERIFADFKFELILLPYTSYLHWGVLARAALNRNIEVFTFGSDLYVLTRITKEFPYHSKDFYKYKVIWNSFNSNLDEKREMARQKLESRLNGKIDDISYMKKSSYEKNSHVTFERYTNNPLAIVLLHCFFDSPHIYGDGLFPDFHEWLDYILLTASKNPQIEYVFKPHPNGLPGNQEIVEGFKAKYSEFKNIRFISSEVSNSQLMQSEPTAIFTYYGTAGHEFAFRKFPVVLAGENPHSGYGFLYEPKSLKEFEFYLTNVGKYNLPDSYDVNSILEFYYMHYLFYSEKCNFSNTKKLVDWNSGEIEFPTEFLLEEMVF